LPILNILVPQVGQVPEVAGLLFFIVIALGAFISLLVRHLTQYASIVTPPIEYEQYNIFSSMSRGLEIKMASNHRFIQFLVTF